MSSDAVARHDEMLDKMAATKKKWDEEDDDDSDDETDGILSKAIEMAIANGRGWSPGEKEDYMNKLSDDDYIPPIFASTQEEVDRSGLGDAFSALMDDETPTALMLNFKKKGADSFGWGITNKAKNMQYFRDAINHYYVALAWADKVEPVAPDYVPTEEDKESDDPLYTEAEMDVMKSTLYANAAMAHMKIKNWGFVRDNCEKSLKLNSNNIKSCYRLAKAHHMLSNWEEAGDAIDRGLGIEGESENKELLKLKKLLADNIRRARLARQKRERARAQRVSKVKEVWKHCKDQNIRLGRVPLVSTVTEDEVLEDEEDNHENRRWHMHHPHTGKLPRPSLAPSRENEWTWPCLFIYPSHNQSDFIETFGESEMLAMRMAEIHPELDDDGDGTTVETSMAWDYNNEFTCSNLAVYFEVHCLEEGNDQLIHPENVEPLNDLKSAMRFYESSRALKGEEGVDMAHLARCVERRHLHRQRKAWKKVHKSLWCKPDLCPVVRVHPAASLKDVLLDSRMVVPNFLVTFILIPENHPAHDKFLKEHKCLGILEAPDESE